MRVNKNRYQVGDVIYQVSKEHDQVLTFEIMDVYLEDYVDGYHTVINCRYLHPQWGGAKFFVEDVLKMFDNEQEANHFLRILRDFNDDK